MWRGSMAGHTDDVLGNISKDTLTKLFEANAFGLFLLTRALLLNLLIVPNARIGIGIISSRVRSVSNNSSGGTYASGSSNAAVNSMGKSLAVDLKDKGIGVSLLHVGYVRTALDPKTH